MRLWLGLACCWLVACRSASYAPAQPRVVTGKAAELSLERVELRRWIPRTLGPPRWSLSAVLAGRFVDPNLPVEVWLSSAYADGCDGKPAFVTSHTRGLQASWAALDQAMFRGPTTIDVRVVGSLDDGSCLRLPLASGARDGRLQLTGRGEWLLSTRVNAELTSSPVTWSVLSLTVGAGTWVGPLRTTLSTGIGSAHCQKDTCPHPDGETLDGGLALPIDFEIEGFVWATRKRALSLALRPGLRISFIDEAQPSPRRVAFTPALVLSYWFMPERVLSKYAQPAREEGGGTAIQLPIGVWQDLDQAQPTGFFVGLSGALALPID